MVRMRSRVQIPVVAPQDIFSYPAEMWGIYIGEIKSFLSKITTEAQKNGTMHLSMSIYHKKYYDSKYFRCATKGVRLTMFMAGFLITLLPINTLPVSAADTVDTSPANSSVPNDFVESLQQQTKAVISSEYISPISLIPVWGWCVGLATFILILSALFIHHSWRKNGIVRDWYVRYQAYKINKKLKGVAPGSLTPTAGSAAAPHIVVGSSELPKPKNK